MKLPEKRKYRRRDRKRQILRVIGYFHYRPVTQREIAPLLNMSPSNHLLDILHDMLHEGDLIREEFEHRPGQIGYRWSISARGEQRRNGMFEMMKNERKWWDRAL